MHYRRRIRLAAIVLVALGMICGLPRSALAARVPAASLLSLYEQGYGVVAAEVVDAKLVTAATEYPAVYETEFKVRDVVAQPLQGDPFPLHAGDPLKLRLTAGYACQIEYNLQSALARGARYYLIVRRAGDGTFEHAKGASALRPVEAFQADEDKFYVQVHDLVALPQASQLMAWVDVVKRPGASDRLRCEALGGVFTKVRPTGGDPHADEARAALLQLWNDPKADLSLALMQERDSFLRYSSKSFEDSPDRRDGWLNKLLTLTPEMTKDDNARDNAADFLLRGLAERDPEVVGQRLAGALPDKRWPALYRREMAAGLLTAYRTAVHVEPGWEPALNAYFVDLMENGDPFPIRVAAGDLEYFASFKHTGNAEVMRTYQPDAQVKSAILAGITRLTQASQAPGADHEFRNAAAALAHAAKVLDGPPVS